MAKYGNHRIKTISVPDQVINQDKGQSGTTGPVPYKQDREMIY
jgi:hypothetical protein